MVSLSKKKEKALKTNKGFFLNIIPKGKYIILAFLLLLSACLPSRKIDIYEFIPKGSKLTKDVLMNAEQIYFNNIDLILLYNISKDPIHYDPHLLFFDKNRRLYASTYFSSQKIKSIEKNIITGFLNKHRDQRKMQYINDLPKSYTLALIPREGGSGRKSDKLIEGIELNFANKIMRVFVRKSKDVYAGLRPDHSSNAGFNMPDTLVIPISQLCFYNKRNTISTSFINNRNYLMEDKMVIRDKLILVNFYNELWEKLSTQF